MSPRLTWKMGSARFLGLHYWVGSDGLGWDAGETTTYTDLGSYRVKEDARAACQADLDKRMASVSVHLSDTAEAMGVPVGEAVAWLSRHDHGQGLRFVTEGWVPDIGWSAPFPVYAHPAPEAQDGVERTDLGVIWPLVSEQMAHNLADEFGSDFTLANQAFAKAAIEQFFLARAALDPDAEVCPACNGDKWVDDQNWSPPYSDIPYDRVPHDGRIPCARCNFAGWNEPDGAIFAQDRRG